MKQFLKGAVVLLITMVIVFSSVAIADTQTKVTMPELCTTHSGSTNGARGSVVWDNVMEYEALGVTQWDDVMQFDSFIADDFHFEEDTEVCDVHWIGGYWGGDPAEFTWCISFLTDDGSGQAPSGHPENPTYAGPFCYSWADIQKEEIEPGYYEMWVDLPENIYFPAWYKFWISIWGVSNYPPQSGWGYHQDPIKLHPAVWGSNYFGFPFWTDRYEALGYDHDMCFQLTTKDEPSIDAEKFVWDEKMGRWVDADTKNEALDVAICNTITYKIVTHNTGDIPLYDIIVKDKMHKSLKYISSDPAGEVYFSDPYWYIEWYFPGPLDPCDIIEIYITAHVEGPKCNYD